MNRFCSNLYRDKKYWASFFAVLIFLFPFWLIGFLQYVTKGK